MELIEKVKKALVESGFPLEMRMARLLEKDGWTIHVGSRYVDFETNIQREIDIAANKSVNGIEVHLVVECKKSDSKQLVLYAPTHNRRKYELISPLRLFPRLKPFDQKFKYTWEKLPMFDDLIPVSNNIIFTKGDKVEQNNDSFFTSLNGMIKKSVDWASDGYAETNFRMIFFHLLIYEGMIYQVQDAIEEDFSLRNVSYGQYEFPYRFKLPEAASPAQKDLNETARFFNLRNIIEVMHPEYFPTYLQQLQTALLDIPKSAFKGWGKNMQKFGEKLMNDPPSFDQNKKGKAKRKGTKKSAVEND